MFLLAVVYAFAGAEYRAQVRVLVRRGRSDPPVAAQENAPPDFSRVEVTEEELNSEVELLKDDDVLRRVVEANDLAARDWLRWLRPHEEEAARVQRAVKKLGRRLDVEAIKKTDLIAVSYDAPDPQVAAHVLQSLAGVYLEKHMEVHRPRGQLHFFDQQTEESRRQLEEAKKKLIDFTNSRGVVMASQQRDLVLQRLDSLEGSYKDTQVQMSETEHRVQELNTQLTNLPERATTQVRTAENPELLRALKASLLDLELKKTQLLTKFEPGTRMVQEVEQQILQAKAAITAERVSPVHDETTDQNSNFEWAKAELQRAQVEIKGLEARKATTGAHLAGYRALARQLGEDAIAQDDLTNSEKAAQENYLLYVKKREEARMGDALDERGIVNVAIAEQPVVPALPVWPAGTVVLVGFVAALTSGTGAAFAADYLDPALRTPEDAAGGYPPKGDEMSAKADVLRRPELIGSRMQEAEWPRYEASREMDGWNPEDFAREQIRGLVRRVFLTSEALQMKQVVFSGAEPHTDVADICDQVGGALALETRGHIAVVVREPWAGEMVRCHPRYVASGAIKSWSTQIGSNLWRVPGFGLRESRQESGARAYWLSCLAGLRIEFEYAVIHGPVAGISSEAAVLGQVADGIILVLRAHSTRRATVRKIKETLETAQARILGTVLSERAFPVPERIYRRL